METVRGQVLEIHPLDALERRADLVFYDGPILELFESPAGEPYLQLWCDVEGAVHRWIVFRVAREQLTRYIDRVTTLRQLVLEPPDGFVYLADIDDLSVKTVRLVRPTELPANYLPASDSYYEFEPIHTELDLAQLAQRYGTPLLNLHLRRGKGVSFGSANIVTLGTLLQKTGALGENVAVDLHSRTRGKTPIPVDEARKYGTFEFVTSKAASFSAILRPVVQQENLPGFEDRTAEVVRVMMELIQNTQDFEGLQRAAGTYSDSVLRGLERLLKDVQEASVQLDVSWAEPRTNRVSRTSLDPFVSQRILDNMSRREKEEAEGLWLEGKFNLLDVKNRMYRFIATTGRETTGRFDTKLAYPITRLSFEQRYKVWVSRRREKLGGHKREHVEETMGQIELLDASEGTIL
jgi:hypothetical protein